MEFIAVAKGRCGWGFHPYTQEGTDISYFQNLNTLRNSWGILSTKCVYIVQEGISNTKLPQKQIMQKTKLIVTVAVDTKVRERLCCTIYIVQRGLCYI